jgi:Zn-dependent protease
LGTRWSRFCVQDVVRYFWKPFTLLRLCRVPVQFHATFLIYPVGFFVWACYVEDSVPGLLRAIVFLVVFSCSLMVHEFAHVLTARHWGIGSRRVILIPLGAVAELESFPGVPSEIWIALAGPLASFALAGLFWLALHAMGPSGRFWLSGRYWLFEVRHLLKFGYAMNLMLALFNLLPCFPMDGGRVLRGGLAHLIKRVFPQHAGQASLIATRFAVRCVAWPVALGMMAWTIIHTQDWMDLLLFPLLVLLAEAEYYLIRTEDGPSRGDDQ